MTTQKTRVHRDRPARQRVGGGPPADVVDRLAGLLPGGELEDALEGLEPEEITGPGGLLTQLAGRVIETALGAELTEHLGYPPGQAPPGGAGNHRNGSTAEDGADRARAGRDPHAARPRRQLRAAAGRPSARPGWRAWTTGSSGSTPAA